nr:hypothetical protein [Tanacetum cinerariifolium]
MVTTVKKRRDHMDRNFQKLTHMELHIIPYPKKEEDPGSFTLPWFIYKVCFSNSIADLGSSVSVMPLSTYLNLGLGELAHTNLTVELADRMVKYPKGIAKNVLVELRRDQVDDLMPTIDESEVVEEFRARNDARMEEIIPMKIDQYHDNAKSDLVESLRTYDSSLIISSKINSLFYEFAGELILLKSIPSRIDETDCDPEEDICLIERLL